VNATINELMCERGIFHVQIHFSSSRATLWSMADPFCYACMCWKKSSTRRYAWNMPSSLPARAIVPAAQVRMVLEKFKQLRIAEQCHLPALRLAQHHQRHRRLTFSCDGSHYIPVHEFLSDECKF